MLKFQSPTTPSKRTSSGRMLATLSDFKRIRQELGPFRLTYRVTCSSCNNTFDYTKSELKEEMIPLAKAEQLVNTYLVCPHCRAKLICSQVKRSTIKL